jgi:hypothetical protein
MSEGGPRPPRIPVEVVDVLTPHWRALPPDGSQPGKIKICPRCRDESYFGFLKVSGLPGRSCPNCGSTLDTKEAR